MTRPAKGAARSAPAALVIKSLDPLVVDPRPYRIERGVRYAHHVGPCGEAGTGPEEVAACIVYGSPYRGAVHVVGTLPAVREYVSRMPRPAWDEKAVTSAAKWLEAGAPADDVWIRAHLCDCRRRAHAHGFCHGERERDTRPYHERRAEMPCCPECGRPDCYSLVCDEPGGDE